MRGWDREGGTPPRTVYGSPTLPLQGRVVARGAWQHAQLLQRRCDRDIKHPGGAEVQIAGGFKNLIGPVMNPNRARRRAAIEPAYIAVGLMKAHQPVHRGHGRERRLDGSFHRGNRCPRDRDLDECAEQRPRAADAIVRGFHIWPIPV